jgi:hypothetical protein
MLFFFLSLGGNENLVKVPHKGDYRYITNERMLGSYIKDETQKDKARLPKDELTCLIGGREDPEKKRSVEDCQTRLSICVKEVIKSLARP